MGWQLKLKITFAITINTLDLQLCNVFAMHILTELSFILARLELHRPPVLVGKYKVRKHLERPVEIVA